MEHNYCRISGDKLKEAFSLGELYVSNFVPLNDFNEHQKYEMKLMFSEKSKLLQLKKTVDKKIMYEKYWYRSGTNETMKNALKNVVESSIKKIKIQDNDIFLDIASNDGTLLSFVPKNLIRIGIDPADNTFRDSAIKHSDVIIQDYFSKDAYKNCKYGYKKAKIITTIAMFYDIDDPSKFLKDIYEILDDEGLFIIQMSYTPLMINQLAFDNICHEHVCYYSLTSIDFLLRQNNFKIVDCELNDINGGSFRIYIRKNISNDNLFSSYPYRDVSKVRIDSILNYEEKNNFNTINKYIDFFKSICELKEKTVKYIFEKKHKKIWGYGASTKGNTLLQWYGLDNTIISGIAEKSQFKFGLKTVGTNIPIYSEEVMRKENPDYLLILPWHFIYEFEQREKAYLDNGGKFIVPCPIFYTIEK